jgi:hypothetical protein
MSVLVDQNKCSAIFVKNQNNVPKSDERLESLRHVK